MPGNKKLLIIFVVLMVLSISLLWWVVRPTAISIKTNAEEIHLKRQELSKLLAEGQSIKKTQKNLQIIKNKIGTLKNIWLKEGQELGFITNLEDLAEKNNLEQVISFDNTKADSEGEIKIISLGLQLSGSLENILAYINDVEALDYYINFQQVELSKRNKNDRKKFPGQIENREEENKQIKTLLSLHLSGLTYWKQ